MQVDTLPREAGVPLPQISRLLGHASLATTQKYLDLSLDLENTISDFVILISENNAGPDLTNKAKLV